MLLAAADLSDVQDLRSQMGRLPSRSLEQSAAEFAALVTARFESVVLCRVFVVLTLEELPAEERKAAEAVAGARAPLASGTRVLSLLASRGREPAWNDRTASRGHRAIPLVDSSFVRGAPMIAKLLADLEVDLANLDEGKPIVTRRMLGGTNMTFYVPDARTAVDGGGKPIIAARDFTEKYGVRTVFGMGGAYAGGELVVVIVFTTEELERQTVDRFPNLIGTFKINTAELVRADNVFGVAAP
ncbi:MAG TPA: hypothetical protein VH062_37125 [Polyangiaceae bacterium]|nr:hypothetical protein [Polyangiaceae bacterium]